MLRTTQGLREFVVEGTDGPIGRVEDFYFDDRAWTIRFLVVKTGEWLAGRDVLISPIAIGEPDTPGKLLPAAVTRQQVRTSPDVDTQKPVSRQHEVEQYGYYGYPHYWGGSGLWGEGMQPRMMMAAFGGAESPETARRQMEFVEAQARDHRERGDDPHLQSCHAVIRYHIHATDGDIGHVDELIVDDETWAIRYMVVNTSDWWLGHQVLVEPKQIADISWLEATISVDLTRGAVKALPAYDPNALPRRVKN